MTVDVRLIAATNVDLRALAREGRFRHDLLDRLSFEVITLPPLRKRREDILLLANHFARRMAAELGRETAPLFSEGAVRTLLDYAWPGNVRELKNVVERLAILTGEAEVITEADVGDALPRVKAVKAEFARGTPFKDLVAAAEREIIMAALDANDHHVSNTAREVRSNNGWRKTSRPSSDDRSTGMRRPSRPTSPVAPRKASASRAATISTSSPTSMAT